MTPSISDLAILIVEPSVPQEKIIEGYLLGFGLKRLDKVRDGADALRYMEQFRPDLVISAMYLPDMTGTDLISAMRSNRTLADIAFMLISSETDVRALEPIRQAGVMSILPKPFKPEQLRQALITTLDLLNPDEEFQTTYSPEELKVLIVDDSYTSRRYIRRVFGNLGIENITEAGNGKEAIKLLNEQFFDLIITDYNMPEMDGQELVNHIRNCSGQSTVPILMVTSESDSNRLAAVEKAGVSAICDKPFEPKMLKSLLERAFVE